MAFDMAWLSTNKDMHKTNQNFLSALGQSYSSFAEALRAVEKDFREKYAWLPATCSFSVYKSENSKEAIIEFTDGRGTSSAVGFYKISELGPGKEAPPSPDVG